MSWKDRLENTKFTIITGDGKTFTPLWKTGEKAKDFNIAKYDFINRAGSFIDRKQPQSNIYPLVFWFQGEDNIEQSDEFEASANDSRAWKIDHPFYGTIKGQPTNLKRKDNFYNVTEINVDFWESIDGEFPEDEVSIEDEVRAKAVALDTISADFMVENSAPSTSDISIVKEQTILVSSEFSPDSLSFNDYQNSINKAIQSADNLVVDVKTAFEDIQAVVNAPAEFLTNVKYRINSYVRAYEILKNNINNLFSRYNFEAQGSTLISAICVSSINPQEGDYITRTDIEEINDILISVYSDYLENLDNNQVDIYDLNNSWSPNVQIQQSLLDLVSSTSAALFQLSFNARQERLIELEKDSNLILLTHRFLGLDSEDKNIEIFRKINNINNDKLFKVKKGTLIKYFV